MIEPGKHLRLQHPPNGGHVRIHRPVGEGDNLCGLAGLKKHTIGQSRPHRCRRETCELRTRAEHQLAVVEFKGKRASGFGPPTVKTMAFSRDRRKGRMHGIAGRGKAIDPHSQAGETVGDIHRAAAGMHVVDHYLAQAAVPGGRGEQRSKRRDVGHRAEIIERPPFADQGDHFIDESIETGHDPALTQVVARDSLRQFR